MILHVECGFFYCYVCVCVYVFLAIDKNPEHVETFYILQVEKDKQKDVRREWEKGEKDSKD